MNLETLANLAELISALGVFTILWKINVFMNRLISLLKDYPPHRHTNGSVEFPTDYPPPQRERLNVG